MKIISADHRARCGKKQTAPAANKWPNGAGRRLSPGRNDVLAASSV